MSDALRGLRASAVPRTRAVEDAPGTCATLRVGIGREEAENTRPAGWRSSGRIRGRPLLVIDDQGVALKASRRRADNLVGA